MTKKNSKFKLFFILTILFSILTLTFINVQAASTGTVVTSGSNLNIRSSPSSSSTRVGKASNGATLEILDTFYGDWYKVRYNGITGYASANYIKIDSFSSSVPHVSQPSISTSTYPVYAQYSSTAQKAIEIAYYFKDSYGSSIQYNKDGLRSNFPYYVDCSAFVWKCYKEAGITLVSTSSIPNTRGIVNHFASTLNTNIDKDGFCLYTYNSNQLMQGDIVLYTRDWSKDLGSGLSKGIGHVGIFVGNNTIIEANNTTPVIRETNLNNPKYILRYVR